MLKNKKLLIVIGINLLIFTITNILFNIKYEQVDDFIIYSLYSGLDGTYNIHGVYMSTVICTILGLLYRIIPVINWHSTYLLVSQFVCFTIIGYTILKKHDNGVLIVLLYAIFASVFYTTLLMLIQYTSVAALLITTSFILFIDMIEQEEAKSIKYKILIFVLFTLGFMTRVQTLFIIIPFMGIYFLKYIIEYFNKKMTKNEIFRIIKYYGIFIVITVLIYFSTWMIYNLNDTYKEYSKYNSIRTELQDGKKVPYHKKFFDKIGWTENDYYLFYTFNFGDENIFSMENIEKILNYRNEKKEEEEFNYRIKIPEICQKTIDEMINSYTYITILFAEVFIVSIFTSKKNWFNILIFFITIGVHALFIIRGRSVHRVVIPEYLIGSALLLYNLNKVKSQEIDASIKNISVVLLTITILCYISGIKYSFGYKLKDFESTRQIINYTNQNKQNVYLYTVPSLQYRYLAYSVYQMPPKGSFSNLRVIGGWDMFTENYYDFKERYNLKGDLLDLLNENVYLIDGEVTWSGHYYENYKEHIITGLKEHYGIHAKCDLVKQFDNLKIYKLKRIMEE